jgi:hypothetical protein
VKRTVKKPVPLTAASPSPAATETPAPSETPTPEATPSPPPTVVTRVQDHESIPVWLIILLGVFGTASLAALGAYVNHRRWQSRG